MHLLQIRIEFKKLCDPCRTRRIAGNMRQICTSAKDNNAEVGFNGAINPIILNERLLKVNTRYEMAIDRETFNFVIAYNVHPAFNVRSTCNYFARRMMQYGL